MKLIIISHKNSNSIYKPNYCAVGGSSLALCLFRIIYIMENSLFYISKYVIVTSLLVVYSFIYLLNAANGDWNLPLTLQFTHIVLGTGPINLIRSAEVIFLLSIG